MSRSNQLAGLITATPTSTLDTINEINTSLNNDANLSTTLTNSIATKAPIASPTFTGEVTVANKLNSSTGNSLTLQSPSGTNVIVNTAGANERLRINSTGDVELKTAGKRFYIPRASDGALTGSLYSSADSTITLSGAGSSAGKLEFISSSTSGSALNIISNGNVGIGDTNPDEKLVVTDNRASKFASVIKNSHASGAGLKVVGAQATQYSFVVRDYTDNTNSLIVLGNGNVGINSANPGQKLAIEGSASANENILRINNQSNHASRIWLRNSGRSAYISQGASTADDIATGLTAGSLSFGHSGTGGIQFWTSNTSPTQTKMTIADSGNVGIGYTSPDQMLYIKQTVNDAYTPNDYNDKSLITLNVPNAQNNYASIRFTHAGGTEGFFGYHRESSTSDRAEFVWQGYDGNSNSYKEYMRLNWEGGLNLEGTTWYLNSRNAHSGADRGIYAQGLSRMDLRTPRPTDLVNSGFFPSFTTYNLNGSSPYADGLFLSTWSDSSGGQPNVMVIRKDGNGVKVARQNISSTSNFSAGSVYTLDYTSASDERVKENVQNITGGLDSILALRPVTYEWTDDYISQGHSKNAEENVSVQEEGQDPVIQIPETKTNNVGFIAQEVEEVIPTVVHQQNIRLATMEEGDFLKDIAYEKLVPHLVSAIQELSAKVTALENAS